MAYINQKNLDDFAKKYQCKVELTTFNTDGEAIAKLHSGQFDFDIFVPTVDVLGQLVAGQVGSPLNHSYIPNITQAWSEYQNPFYDQNWQYTVPTPSTPPVSPGGRTRWRRTPSPWPTRGPCPGTPNTKGRWPSSMTTARAWPWE